MKLNEITHGKNYLDWLNSLDSDRLDTEMRRIAHILERATFLRQSELFNEDKFGGDIVQLNNEAWGNLTYLYHSMVPVSGDISCIFDDEYEYIPLSIRNDCGKFNGWNNLIELKGKTLRVCIEAGSWLVSTDFRVQEDCISGNIYISQYVSKPHRFTRIFEFNLKKDPEEFEINIVEDSLFYLFLITSMISAMGDNPANSKYASIYAYLQENRDMFSPVIEGNGFTKGEHDWNFFAKSEFLYTIIDLSFKALLVPYVITCNRNCGFEETYPLKTFKSEVFDFDVETKWESIDEIPKMDMLDMGIDPIYSSMEYLTLVCKIAELGSSVVVPRDSILSLADFSDKYFVTQLRETEKMQGRIKEESPSLDLEDTESYTVVYSLREESKDEIFNKLQLKDEYLQKFYSNHGFSRAAIQRHYFTYVWNSLYFKIPDVWKEIKVLNGKDYYVIKYDMNYNSLELTHYAVHDNGSKYILFKGDIDLGDISIRTYVSNPLLSSFRSSFRSVDATSAINSFIGSVVLSLGRRGTLMGNELTPEELFGIIVSDLECSMRYEILDQASYSFDELLNLFDFNSKQRKENILASAFEDYSYVIMNYILIVTLVCEKSKIKEALRELRGEIEEDETDDDRKRKQLEAVDRLESEELIDKNGNVYVFNNPIARGLDKALGKHLRTKREKCKYTTPYWVRRGFYKTTRSGERIWIPEQICRRSPELLSVEAEVSEDKERIYKATNLFGNKR